MCKCIIETRSIITDHQLFIEVPAFLYIRNKPHHESLKTQAKPRTWCVVFHKSEIESKSINLLGNLGQVLSEFWKIIVFIEKSMQIIFLIFSSFGHF